MKEYNIIIKFKKSIIYVVFFFGHILISKL